MVSWEMTVPPDSKANRPELGGPLAETGEDLFLQQEVPVQTGAPPAAGGSLPGRRRAGNPAWSVSATVRAIQTCRDLAD